MFDMQQAPLYIGILECLFVCFYVIVMCLFIAVMFWSCVCWYFQVTKLIGENAFVMAICENKVLHRHVCIVFLPNPPIAIAELPNCLSHECLTFLKPLIDCVRIQKLLLCERHTRETSKASGRSKLKHIKICEFKTFGGFYLCFSASCEVENTLFWFNVSRFL